MKPKKPLLFTVRLKKGLDIIEYEANCVPAEGDFIDSRTIKGFCGIRHWDLGALEVTIYVS